MLHSTRQGQTLKDGLQLNDLLDLDRELFRNNRSWNTWKDVFGKRFQGRQAYIAGKIARTYLKIVLLEAIKSNYHWYLHGAYLGVIHNVNANNPEGKYNPKTKGKHYYIGIQILNLKYNWRKFGYRTFLVWVHQSIQSKLTKEINRFHIYD